VGQAADELRNDIERTRDDMAETLDAIGEKLKPPVEPRRIALAAGALMMLLLLIRRRRKSKSDGD
jgi:hypothetical protein